MTLEMQYKLHQINSNKIKQLIEARIPLLRIWSKLFLHKLQMMDSKIQYPFKSQAQNCTRNRPFCQKTKMKCLSTPKLDLLHHKHYKRQRPFGQKPKWSQVWSKRKLENAIFLKKFLGKFGEKVREREEKEKKWQMYVCVCGKEVNGGIRNGFWGVTFFKMSCNFGLLPFCFAPIRGC